MGTRIPDNREPLPRPVKAEVSPGPQRSQIKKSGLPVSASGNAAGQKTHGVNRETVPHNLKNPAGNAHAAPGLSPKAVFSGKENRVIESNSSLLNTVSPNPLAEKIAGAVGTETVSAGELFKQIARMLGLPQDSLSVSLIAFLRFFSLSPDPVSIKTFRREILASPKTSSSETARGKAAQEAKTLAMVSVFDKGVDLSQKALDRYAQYLAPEAFSEEGETGEHSAASAPDNGGDDSREELPNAEELRSIAEKQSKKDDLLDFLNSLPGKNGKYWKLFPFKINVRGTELKVFLRLLKREPFCPGESEYVIAGIAGPKRQWRCFLEKTDKKLRADIQVYPELSAKALGILEKEAERFFGHAIGKTGIGKGNFSGFDEIRVRNGEEIPSWIEDLCNEHLLSINEEV